MIFNMTGGGKAGGMPPVPEFTGTMNLVYLSEDGSSGYAEFTGSGVLTWLNDWVPEGVKFDLFCVGAGGGSSGSGSSEDYKGRAGAGGGYTTTVKGVALPQRVDITIGAGGAAGSGTTSNGNRGGTTSIGELCVAEGGYGNSGTTGGDGGSGGGCGSVGSSSVQGMKGGDGGTNGSDGSGGTAGANGRGQGSPTTDLLGRVHAGGGAGSYGYSPVYGSGTAGAAGASDFAAGKGNNNGGPGGGGFGGGAGGCRPNNNGYSAGYAGAAGGNGFAMIAWGDYLNLYEGGAA